jgi:hypothetical protein
MPVAAEFARSYKHARADVKYRSGQVEILDYDFDVRFAALSDVRQAHMPGNYELYDEPANRLGPVICKLCWELFNKQEFGSLNTVWVTFEGRRMVWWLCADHMSGLKTGGQAVFLRSVQGVVQSPGM